MHSFVLTPSISVHLSINSWFINPAGGHCDTVIFSLRNSLSLVALTDKCVCVDAWS